MPAKPFVLTERDYARPYEVFGMQITVLLSSGKTAGYEIVQQAGPQGSGLPLHHHPWAESNYVVKGEVEFMLDEEITWGTAGSVIHIPAGMAHGFRFGQDGAVTLSISSHSGAVKLFAALDRELIHGEINPARLHEIGVRLGLTVLDVNRDELTSNTNHL